MTRINIELDDELHKQAKLQALLSNKTLIQYITEALNQKVKDTKNSKGGNNGKKY